MGPLSKFAAALAATLPMVALFALPAAAECKRFGFTVNDYGKDGPTKDAKSLLDKLIASKMQERGVSEYKTGGKSVKCELFLNFIVFDEHTCTAEATVCWGDSQLPASEQNADSDDGKKDDTKKTASKKKSSQKATDTATATVEEAPVSEKAEKPAKKQEAKVEDLGDVDPNSLPQASAESIGTPAPAKAAKADTVDLSPKPQKKKVVAEKPKSDKAVEQPAAETASVREAVDPASQATAAKAGPGAATVTRASMNALETGALSDDVSPRVAPVQRSP